MQWTSLTEVILLFSFHTSHAGSPLLWQLSITTYSSLSFGLCFSSSSLTFFFILFCFVALWISTFFLFLFCYISCFMLLFPSYDSTVCTCHPSLPLTCLTLLPFTGPVSVRSHPAPEAPGNSIGLEAIIRKALMGKYDDQSEERSPSNATNPLGSGMPVADGRAEDCFSQGATSYFPSASSLYTKII